MNRSQYRNHLILICICIVIGFGVVIGYRYLYPLREFSMWTQNQILRIGDKQTARTDLVLIGIDKASQNLDMLFPEEISASEALTLMDREYTQWSRKIYALLIERLMGAGARSITFDIHFKEAREGDADLKQMISQYADRVTLGYEYNFVESSQGYFFPAIKEPSNTVIDLNTLATPQLGHFMLETEKGQVRAITPVTSLADIQGFSSAQNEEKLYSLSAATLEQISPNHSLNQRIGDDYYISYMKGVEVAYAPLSLYSIFDEQHWQHNYDHGQVFKDKIIFIGPTDPIFQDYHITPFGRMLGAHVHMSALTSMLGDTLYQLAPAWVAPALLFLVSLIVLLSFCLSSNSKTPLIFISLTLLGLVVLSYFCYMQYAIMLDYAPALTAGSASAISLFAFTFIKNHNERKQIQKTLERYVSRNLVKEILDNPKGFLQDLGGTEKPLVMLFSDIRGFTAQSENNTPTAIIEQLNEYLGEMVQVIFQHKGTADKFVGDAILAVWGSVSSLGPKEDAYNAVLTALHMQNRIEELNQNWRRQNKQPYTVGIGVHAGIALFGNLGSQEKMEPTVIGDNVNLSSRLEGLTKYYQLPIVISQQVQELLPPGSQSRYIDRVQVKGRKRAIVIYQPLSVAGEVQANDAFDTAWLDRYEQAMDCYQKQEFSAALTVLTALHEQKPSDFICSLYIDRCQHFMAKPPAEDWQAIHVMDNK